MKLSTPWQLPAQAAANGEKGGNIAVTISDSDHCMYEDKRQKGPCRCGVWPPRTGHNAGGPMSGVVHPEGCALLGRGLC